MDGIELLVVSKEECVEVDIKSLVWFRRMLRIEIGGGV